MENLAYLQFVFCFLQIQSKIFKKEAWEAKIPQRYVSWHTVSYMFAKQPIQQSLLCTIDFSFCTNANMVSIVCVNAYLG